MMPRVALLCVLALLTATGTALGAPGPHGVRYALDVVANGGGRLTGTQDIEVRHARRATHLWLRTYGNGPAGCRPQRVRIRMLAGGSIDRVARSCTAVRVRLERVAAAGERSRLRLALTVQLPRARARFGQAGRLSLYGNALPVVAPVGANGRPLLDPYIALGDPFVTLSAHWRVRLSYPAHLRALTSGHHGPVRRTGPRQRTLVARARAARDFFIAIGPLARETAVGVAGVRLSWDPREAPGAVTRAILLAGAARAWRDFTRDYGAPPPGGLDVLLVPGLESEGMEYPGVVLSDPHQETVVHEVAHQWFAVLVGSNGWQQPWLDETLATFIQMRHLGLLANCSPTAPFAAYGSARLTWTLRRFARTPEDYGAVYDGGACALARLQQEWGDARVRALLAAFVRQWRNDIAHTDDFVHMLRARAPVGYDLGDFLRFARLTP